MFTGDLLDVNKPVLTGKKQSKTTRPASSVVCAAATLALTHKLRLTHPTSSTEGGVCV